MLCGKKNRNHIQSSGHLAKHFAFLLPLVSIFPGEAERFHTARLQIAGGGSDVPDLDEVKKWAAFFAGKEGGGMTHLNAVNKAFETLLVKGGQPSCECRRRLPLRPSDRHDAVVRGCARCQKQ